MTRPLGEPSVYKKLAAQRRALESLARRPGTGIGPSAKVRRTSSDSTVNVPDGFTFSTYISWTDVLWDSGDMWASGNPTRLTAPIDGIYHIVGTCNYDGGFAGMYGAAIDQSPAGDFPGETQFAGDGTYFVNIQAIAHVKLLTGEYVEFVVEQKTGAARPLLNIGCNFAASWIAGYPL